MCRWQGKPADDNSLPRIQAGSRSGSSGSSDSSSVGRGCSRCTGDVPHLGWGRSVGRGFFGLLSARQQVASTPLPVQYRSVVVRADWQI